MQRLSGIAASEGIVIGEAFVLDRHEIKSIRRRLEAHECAAEIARFKRAIEETDQQLQQLKEKLYKAGGEEHTLILQAHQLILKDETLTEQTIRYIKEQQINAEWAISQTVEAIKQVFNQVENEYFRQRGSDVDFVAGHLLVTLSGSNAEELSPPYGAIIVAHDLSPSDTARLHRTGVKAFVTDLGGITAHTSILARSLGIPAVVGLKGITTEVRTGMQLIVDGYRGDVLIEPEDDIVARYNARKQRRAQRAEELKGERELPAVMRDGEHINLLANIELSDEVQSALAAGAQGIGLYRTEYLFLGRDSIPDEEAHYQDAKQVLEQSGQTEITFRTCDLGADKLPGPETESKEKNPALGFRSIRLCLKQQDLFRAQLRGILRAASLGKVRLLFPMISGVEEFRQAKKFLFNCAEELRHEGHKIPAIQVGAMIEMPSAAITADLLAKEADFFSIGTNDLTQYVLATDRVNQQVNHLFQPHHPAVLRMIKMILDAAQREQISTVVCGEMAADPLMTLLLVGLGVRNLSMNAFALPRVKRVIRESSLEQAKLLATRVLALTTPDEVANELRSVFGRILPSSRGLVERSGDDESHF